MQPPKRDLIALENHYHMGPEAYKPDGSLDHNGLVIDRLFGRQKLVLGSKPDFSSLPKSSLLDQVRSFVPVLAQDTKSLLADPQRLQKAQIEPGHLQHITVDTFLG